jgi:glycosyltransferase 2 family protein
LDLSLFLEGAIDGKIFLVAFMCNLAMVSSGAVRWNFLLLSQKVSLPFSWVHNMAYLSMCFNLLVPGSVGGDALRMKYGAGMVPDRKGAVILTVLGDRFIGLYGLLCLCLVGLSINYSTALSVVPLKLMMISVAAIVVGGPLLFLLFFFLLPRITWLRAYVEAPPAGRIGSLVHVLVDALRHFMQAKTWLFMALLTSIFAQAVEVFALIWIAMGLDMMTIPAEGFFVAAPLAWVINVIPISPGGLGVGEAAFDQVCHWLQPVETVMAFGTIFFINRVIQMLASLPGFFVYIFYKQKEPSVISS